MDQAHQEILNMCCQIMKNDWYTLCEKERKHLLRCLKKENRK